MASNVRSLLERVGVPDAPVSTPEVFAAPPSSIGEGKGIASTVILAAQVFSIERVTALYEQAREILRQLDS